MAQAFSDILPYAENEIDALHALGRNDEDTAEEAEEASEILKGATAIYNKYMSSQVDYSKYLKTQPLNEVLWWFIENVSEDTPRKIEYFFILRERIQKETK